MNYLEVLPDKVALIGKHYTPGRAGHKIRKITIHHTAGVLTATGINQVWATRPASAHYLVDFNGVVSQHVWDRDTAWSNANLFENQTSITIEHSNSAGPAADWPINDVTIITGARLTAAVCRFYNLGRPVAGVNVTFHYWFAGTSCPYHLRPGHKYHERYMREAQRFYDELTSSPPAPPRKRLFMYLSEAEEKELLAKTRQIHSALLSPVPSRVPGSKFTAPRVDFIDLIDRKVEELHVEYAGKSSQAQDQVDKIARESDEHDPADELHHDDKAS